MDAEMARSMSFQAHAGHPCGINFDAVKFLNEHHEYSWESPILRNLDSGPWTPFRIGEHATALPWSAGTAGVP
jgi:hypothetical protein